MTQVTTEYMDQQLVGNATYSFSPATLGTCAYSGRANKNAYKDTSQASPATAFGDLVQQLRDEREAVGGSAFPFLSEATSGLRPAFAPQMCQLGGIRYLGSRMQFNGLSGVDKSNCTLAITGIPFTDFSQLQSPVLISLDAIPNAMTLQLDGVNASLQLQPDANYDAADHNATTLSVPLSPYQAITLQSTAAGVVVNVNGVNSATFPAAAAHVGTNGFVGDWSNLNSTLNSGWISRVLVYSPALSPTDLATLQAGLAAEATLNSLWPLNYNVVAFPGDSLTQGVGHGTITPAQTYPAQTISSLASPVGFLLAALSGKTIDQAANAWTPGINGHLGNVLRTGKQCVSFWCGTNDIAAGTAGGTVYTDYKGKLGGFKSSSTKVLAWTIMNNAGFSGPNITQQGVFNTAIRADFATATANPHVFLNSNAAANADILIDVQSVTQLQNTSDTSIFSDGTHLTQLGYSYPTALVVFALGLIGIS